MGRDELIDDYLDSVRGVLRHRPDAEAVLLELEDHLLESVERRRLAGSRDAVSESLEAFGSPAAVTRSLLLTPAGGLALPTRATRLAGGLGVGAALLWAISAVAGTVAMGGFMEFSSSVYWVWAGLAGAAGVATGGLLVGAMVRSGAAGFGRWTVGVGVVSLCTASATVAMTWFWAALLVPLSMLGVATVVRLSRVGLVDRRLVPLAFAWPIGAIVLVIGEAMEVGRVDEYGDHPIAFVGAYAIAALLWGILLALIGATLRTEQPIDPPDVVGA
jgi:hypothetical protein